MRYVKWFVRSAGAPPSETAANLWRSFWAFVTGTETPWVVEAREAAEEEAAEAANAGGEEGEEGAKKEEEDKAEGGSHKGGSHKSRSTTSSVRSAKALSSYKRQVMVVGLIATIICWAIFVWFIFTCAWHCAQLGAPPALCVASHAAAAHPARRWHADLPLAGRGRGAVVRALVGHQLRHQRGGGGTAALACLKHACVCSHLADHAFSNVQWKDVATEAAKAAVILAILERLFLTSNANWLEARARVRSCARC